MAWLFRKITLNKYEAQKADTLSAKYPKQLYCRNMNYISTHQGKRRRQRCKSKSFRKVSQIHSKIFAIADVLAGGTPDAISSGYGGRGNSGSFLRWDGRRPDEKEEAHLRRCLMFAIWMVKRQHEKKYYRK